MFLHLPEFTAAVLISLSQIFPILSLYTFLYSVTERFVKNIYIYIFFPLKTEQTKKQTKKIKRQAEKLFSMIYDLHRSGIT